MNELYTIARLQNAIGTNSQLSYPNTIIQSLCIDTRTLENPENTLFFALSGKRRDGHTYIDEAYKKGVRNFIVQHKIEKKKYPHSNFIISENPLQALQKIAAFHREQFTFPLIGITGSKGKTTLKEWLGILLEKKHKIIKNPHSFNSQIGVPLSLWNVSDLFNLGIFEAGISEMKEMEYLERIIKPDIGIITHIDETHNSGFTDIKTKIQEKLQLFKRAKILIANYDKPLIKNQIAHFKKAHNPNLTIFSIGSNPTCTLQILNRKTHKNTTHLTLSYKDTTYPFNIPFANPEAIENFLYCLSVFFALNLPIPIIKPSVFSLLQLSLRIEKIRGINQCTIIYDTYNHDFSTLQTLIRYYTAATEKTTLILSDFELRKTSYPKLIKALIPLLKERNITRLIMIGKAFETHKDILQTLPHTTTFFYENTFHFINNFHHFSFYKEHILVKGGQGFYFEKIIRIFTENTHETRLEINLSHIKDNFHFFQSRIPPTTKLMLMVKAFSYGSKLAENTNFTETNPIDYLSVAYTSEGISLRKKGVNIPIMVLNPEPIYYEEMLLYDLEPEIFSIEGLQQFIPYVVQQKKKAYPIHLKIDTGMHRLGFTQNDLPSLLTMLRTHQKVIKVQSVFSHLVGSETAVFDTFTKTQAQLLKRITQKIKATVNYPVLQHIANTHSILRHPELALDMVRLGIGLYGIDLSNTTKELKHALTLKTNIAQIKTMKKGGFIGYNQKGKLLKNSVIATLRIGYADGYLRILGNQRGKVLIKGYLAPIIGNICMDMMMVDITNIPNVQVGDTAILFSEELPVTQIAKWAKTIPYEIMTALSDRVPRVYIMS